MDLLVVLAAGAPVVALGSAGLVMSLYHRIGEDQALVISRAGAEPVVSFRSTLVWPIVHQAEVMDLTVKAIAVSRTGRQGLLCRDRIRADVETAFFLRVNPTAPDVLRVARSVGCARAASQKVLHELFLAKFSAELDKLAIEFDFDTLLASREAFEDRLVGQIGRDLNGFVLEGLVLGKIAQTPIEMLDPNNVSDARGIAKTLEITLERARRTEELRRELANLDTDQNHGNIGQRPVRG
jgi:uncharacterized membrane protein YqiK